MVNDAGCNDDKIKALIAPILGITAEDIDSFIILVRGHCPDCGGGHDATSMNENLPDYSALAELMLQGLEMKLSVRHERDELWEKHRAAQTVV